MLIVSHDNPPPPSLSTHFGKEACEKETLTSVGYGNDVNVQEYLTWNPIWKCVGDFETLKIIHNVKGKVVSGLQYT